MHYMNELEVFAEAEKNLGFLNDNFKELEKKYPNKFVAISGGEMVAVNENPRAIFEEVEHKGIERSKILVEFIPVAGSILVL